MELLESATAITDTLTPYLEVDRSRPQHEYWATGHMVAGLDGTAAINDRVGVLSTEPELSLFRCMRPTADVVLVGARFQLQGTTVEDDTFFLPYEAATPSQRARHE